MKTLKSALLVGVVALGLATPALAADPPSQGEVRTYSAVSNIMKTKHDTVKNSISNVR